MKPEFEIRGPRRHIVCCCRRGHNEFATAPAPRRIAASGGLVLVNAVTGQAELTENQMSGNATFQALATNRDTVGPMDSRHPRILDSRIWLVLGVLAFCLGISVYVCRTDRVIAAREGTAVGTVTDRQSVRLGTRIIYTFSVRDQWFTGSNSSLMSDALWAGAQVSVYYDSQNPNENALIDFAALSQSPYRAASTWWDAKSRGWLVAGGLFLFPAVIGTFTGETLVRFQGVVRRVEDPKGFWWDVSLYYFFGAIFIALYLLN
jgi:hypothetical protein